MKTMIRKIKLTFLMLGLAGLLVACSLGGSAREQALEATVAALQNQLAQTQTAVVPLATATAAPTSGPDWRQYIGIVWPPFPEGWDSSGGALTYSNCDFGSPCPEGEESYVVSQWQRTDGTEESLLVFGKLVRRDEEGRAYHQVLDMLVSSEIGGSNWLWQGCRVGDSAGTDNEIVALYGIVQDPSTPAWRANHLTGRFEPVSTEGLTCVDENAGP